MSIAKRIVILIVLSVLALLALAGVNRLQTETVFQGANYGNTHVTHSILLLHKASHEFGKARVRVSRHVMSTPGSKEMALAEEEIKESRHEIDAALEEYEKTLVNDADRRLAGDLHAAIKTYREIVGTVLEHSRAGKKDEARDLLFVGLAKAAHELDRAYEASMKFNQDLGASSAAEAESAKSRAEWISIGVALLAVAVLSLIGFGTVRSVTGRVDEASRFAGKIASGDLSHASVPAAGDEIGRLLTSLDKMRADLSTTIRDIVAQSEAVQGTATQVAEAAQQVAASSEYQTESTSAAAAAVEELTVSIDHVGGGADEAHQRASNSEDMALSSARDVDSASAQIEDVSQRVERTAQQIQSLADQVQKIGNVTTVIRDVADQINLLALNAAIEAARAGEQGRGFAVVADEVRKLAERTTHSVQEIAAMISSIQGDAVTAVGSMQSSLEVVSEVVQSARRASESMMGIRSSAKIVQSSISGISEALREQRTASMDLSRNVELIAQQSEENAGAIASVSSAANQLQGISDELKASVSHFRL